MYVFVYMYGRVRCIWLHQTLHQRLILTLFLSSLLRLFLFLFSFRISFRCRAVRDRQTSWNKISAAKFRFIFYECIEIVISSENVKIDIQDNIVFIHVFWIIIWSECIQRLRGWDINKNLSEKHQSFDAKINKIVRDNNGCFSSSVSQNCVLSTYIMCISFSSEWRHSSMLDFVSWKSTRDTK